jgi:membrane protein
MAFREQSRRLWRRGEVWLFRLGDSGRRWSVLSGQALQRTFGSETGTVASSIGYYTLFSLFPLILLTVAIASLYVDPTVAQSEMMAQLEFITPGLGELLGQNIQSIVRARAPISGVAVLILLWAASNIFAALTQAMDRVWEVELPWSQSAFRQRGLAVFIVLFTGVIILMGSLYGGTVVAIVNTFYPDALRPYRPYASQLWAVLVNIGLFAMLYRFLPHRKLGWRDIMPGAITAGIVWQIGKWGFHSIIDVYLSRSNLVYGSLTTIIVFLTWTYVTSFIFLFGAYLNVVYVLSSREEE